MMFWYGGHWVVWQAALMWVGMLAFSGVLGWLLFLAIGVATKRDDGRGQAQDARQLLDERLARGEVDVGEYRRVRDEFEASRSARSGVTEAGK